ncbi:WD40 repeat domain-containing protein [Photobacterium damselae]|uniref:WD40 repeat domain-containing protein n=1 Tax=Photobacterium damselae TaxID=38293 RepID=UPI0040684A91
MRQVTVLLFLIVACFSLTGCLFNEKAVQGWDIDPQGATTLSLNPQGQIALVASSTQGLSLWDLHQSKKLATLGWQDPDHNLILHSAFSNNSRFAITATAQTFTVWDLGWGKALGLWSIDDAIIEDVAIANNGEKIALALSNNKVLYLNLGTGRRLEFLGHREKVNSVDMSANGKYVLSGGSDNNAFLWSTQTGQVIYPFPMKSRITQVALQQDGRFALVGDSTKHIAIWDLKTGQQQSKLNVKLRQQIISSARFSLSGDLVITGTPAGRVELWSALTGKNIKRWQMSGRKNTRPAATLVYDVAISPNTTAIAGTSAGLINAWSTE